MRGNHIIWGRQDYVEPPPLPPEALARVAMCSVMPRWPDRTKPYNWHEVWAGDDVIGFVKTGLGGQSYRTPDMDDWFLVAWDWNRADPPHAHAVLRLLDAVNASAEASV